MIRTIPIALEKTTVIPGHCGCGNLMKIVCIQYSILVYGAFLLKNVQVIAFLFQLSLTPKKQKKTYVSKPQHNLCKQANKISSRASAFFLDWFLTTALQKCGLRLGCHRRGENERGYVVLPETHVIHDLILVEAWTDILEIGMTRGTGGERFST